MRLRSGLLVLLVAASACSSGSPGPSFVRIEGQVPPVRGTTLAGATFGPRDYAGKILVLNFWNQDCPPCRRESPQLARAYRSLRGRGVVFVGVVFVGQGWPDDPVAARAFLQEQGIDYPGLRDPTTGLARALDVAGIPTTVVADRDGQLRFKVLGPVEPGDLERVVDEIDGGYPDG